MNPDNLGENLDNSKKKERELYGLFIDKFVNEVKSSSYKKDKRNELIEKIGTGDSIQTILPELKYFHSSLKQDNKEFENFEVEKLNFFDVKRAFTKDFVKMKSVKSNFISELTRNYELDDKKLQKVRKALEKKGVLEIENLAKDINATEKFLQKEAKVGKLKAFDINGMLDGITEKEVSKRLKKISNEDKEKVELALGRLAEGNYSELDFETLFTANFFNDKEKKYFLRKYNSAISLKQAVDFGLITNSEAEKKKKEIIKNVISKDKSLVDLDNDKLDILKGEIDLRDIKVDVLDLDLDDKKINKFVIENNGLTKLEKEIEDSKKEMEENHKNKAPENFRTFKKLLGEKYPNNVENLGSFDNGNYLKITRIEADGKSYNKIYEIISKDNNSRGLSLKIIGDEGTTGVDINSNKEAEDYNYSDIILMLENSSKESGEFKLGFISKQNLLEKLHSENSSLKSSNYTSFTEKDLEDPELKNNYIGELEKEIEELEQEIGVLKKEKGEDNSGKIKQLEEFLKHKKQRLDNLSTDNGKSENLDILNFEKLIRDLDSIDSEGAKFGLKKGLFLEAEKGIAEIYGIDAEKNQVIVKQAGQVIPLSFASFYASFKKHSLKRVEKINDFGLLLDSLKSSGVNVPDNYKFNNGNFIAEKEGSDSKDKKVKFFVSKDGKEIVRIDSIDGDKLTITLGTRKKNEGREIHSMQKNSETLSLNEFKAGICERKMVPDWTIGANKKDLQHKEDPRRKGDFGTRFLNRLSVTDLLFAGKMFVDNFEETLKRGSEAQSAKFALKLGKYMPDDLRHNLQIKVEAFDKEERDKELDKLDKIDSGDAARKIKKWLKNRDTPDYKIEAAMLFMLQKYGHLTAKGKDDDSLFEFRGQFMWYQALGGRIGDELYNEELERARAGGNTFSEEGLVYALVSRQCKNAGGYNGKKRSSKLYKEVEGKAGAGIDAEIKKGYDDAAKKNFVEDMVGGGIGELKGGTTANSVGWFKKAVEKGGSLDKMNEGFFILLYSGTLYEVDGNILNNIKNIFEADKMPIIMAQMCKNVETMNTARAAILEISKKIEKEYPDKHAGIYEEALKIFNNATGSFSGKPEDKIKDTIDFFNEHGKPIIRAMNMVNTSDTTYSKTDKTIIFEKDDNPALKKYYDTIRVFTEPQMNSFGKAGMEDACGEVGLTGLNVRSVTEQWLKLYTGKSFKDQDIAARVWKELHSDIASTKNKLFVGKEVSSPENQIYQKKYLRYILRELLSGMRANHTGPLLEDYDVVGDMSTSIRAWGIAPVGRLQDYSPNDIMDGKADEIINNAIGVILGEKGEFSSGGEADDIDILKEGIKSANDDLLN